ncbi:heat shock protein 67B2-like [Varroa destructor]|uniref:Rhodanese domain-containing protein n=1 Tax=Varroa destructor TaxID=109461 RepID=A0A7M7J914_VARDE|nr:heat shock protein 67B2-like [Varroa destructor]
MADVDPSRCVDFDEVLKCVGNHDFMIVDVRSPQEVKDDGSIQGTVNVPIDEVSARFGVGATALSEKMGRSVAEDGSNVIFHCKGGTRATKAALAADEFGFKKSRVYQGGLMDWIARGGTVCKDFCPF